MKKIIYSLVIMIAAGSLFTSCIEQVEPLGIQDMRFAKAEYIRALKDLRAADAELVRAEAAHELARARYVDAMTANLNADTEYQNLLNEYQQLINEARQDTNDFISQETANKIDSIKKRMELRELQHQKDMVAAQDSLANAQERLRVALRNIALASQSLTEKEKEALENATKAYEIAFEKVANQTVAVFKAQQALDSAKIMLARADKDVNEDTWELEDALTYYQNKLDAAKAKALVSGALLTLVGLDLEDLADSSNIILPEDLTEWKNKIEEYKEANNTIDYNHHEIIEEIAGYYVTYIHDGWKAYNDAIKAVADKYKTTGTTADTYDGKLTSTEKTMLEYGEPEKEWFVKGFADTIAFPAYVSKGTPTTAMFEYLLGDYFYTWEAGTDTDLDYDVTMLEYDSEEDAYFLRANQSMKDFVLGSDMATVHSQKYTFTDTAAIPDKTMKWEAGYYDPIEFVKGWDYGLKGAIAVLERKNVVGEQTIASYADSTDKYYNIWKKDRDSLNAVFAYYPSWKATNTTAAKKKAANGGVTYKQDYGYLYGKYAPYTTAIDNYKTAKDAYDQAVEAVTTQETNLIGAIKTLKAEFDKVDGKSDITYNDSLAIFNALKDFAAKREAYLGYKYDSKHKLDSTKFYYGSGTDYTGKIIISSIKIADMTFDDLRAKKFDNDTVLAGAVLKPWAAENAGLAGMAIQILNDKFYTAVGADPMDFSSCGTTVFNENDYRALYNIYTIDDYTNPTKITVAATGEEYEKTVDDTDLTKAENAVVAAIDKYEEDLYCRFWGAASYPGVTDELNPKGYNDTTFTDKFPIVNFYEDDYLMDTRGLQLALNAYASEYTDVYVAILGENYGQFIQDSKLNSEFMKWMYWLSKKVYSAPDTNDLEDLKKWVAAVEAAFVADAEQATVIDEEAYEDYKEAYDELVAKKEALVKFTGADKKGNPKGFTRANDYSTLTNFFDETATPALNFNLAKRSSLYDVFTGKWNLSGTQAELAETIFPGLTANLVEWEEAIAEEADAKAHNTTLQTALEKAYVSAAKAKYDLTTTTDDMKAVIAAYQSEALAELQEVIDAYKKAAVSEGDTKCDIQYYTEMIRDFEVNVGLGKVNPAQFAVADAERILAIAKARLQGYQEVLAYAKANLDKILEYIKSLDVNFVVVTDQDIQNQQN